MRFLRTVKGWSRLDMLPNEDIRSEIKVSPFFRKVDEYKNGDVYKRQVLIGSTKQVYPLVNTLITG